jgi:membrane-bound lytic murein transglycosylase D
MRAKHAEKSRRLLLACATTLAGLILFQGPAPDARTITSSSAWRSSTEAAAEELKDSDELYRLLDESCEEYERGIQLIKEGNKASGEQKTDVAQDRLLAGARRCAMIEGCDIQRFFDAFAEMRDIRQAALIKDGPAVSEPEIHPADAMERASLSPSSEAVLPSIGTTAPLFRGKDLRELLDLNEPVKAALNDWLTWMRPDLMDSYQNYLYLRKKMAPIYQEAGLPEALLFGIIATETGGKVHARSRAGAAGPLQFMRSTGRRYGLTVEDGFDMRYDPVASTRANVSYLNEHLEMLNESLEKTLAAYNGGENRVRRLNRRFKDSDFWDSRFYNSLPGETRRYVPRVLAASWLFLHPEDYNLRFPRCDTATAILTVEQDTSLDELCICFGQELEQSGGWFRTLRNLNPRLDPEKPIKAGTKIEIPTGLKRTYEDRCLQGILMERARALHEAKYPEMIIYTVVAGDTVGTIAARYQCASQREIITINNLRGPKYIIRVGQKLKIPGCY